MGRVFKRTHEESGFPQIQSLRNPCSPCHELGYPSLKKAQRNIIWLVISPLWLYHDIAIISLWNGCFSKAHWMSDTWTGNPGTYSTGGCWPISKPWAKKRALGKCRMGTVAPSMFKTAAVFTSHKFCTSSKQSLPPFFMFHPPNKIQMFDGSAHHSGRKNHHVHLTGWDLDSKPYLLPGSMWV